MGIDLCFVLHCCDRDLAKAKHMADRIRLLHREAILISIGDGLAPPDGDLTVPGKRLKLSKNGAAWSKRWMELAYQSDCDRVIRIDPDTWLWRRFNSFPDCDIGGTVVANPRSRVHYVRGACVCFKRSAIGAILDSKLLDDPIYGIDPMFGYYRYGMFAFPGEVMNSEFLYTEDPTVAHIAAKLRLSLGHWDEVCIGFRETPPPNNDLRLAATHPHP